MKKFRIFLWLIGLAIFVPACKTSGLTKIKLAEVAHSVFYAPQYVAIELGYFKDEGLEIELFNANGADKVTTSLLSKDFDVGLLGPESSIYLYNQKEKNYLIDFAQLTTTDGSFIFGREPIENFTWDMLKGKSILGGRVGGVPEMTLEYVIKKQGLTLEKNSTEKDVNVRTDIAFAAMAGSFLSGEGDFTTLFEPVASQMILEKKAYLLTSVGQYAGEITYTAYSTTKNYLEKYPDRIEKFTRAIYRGQVYVATHTDEEVAKLMMKQFPDQSLEILENVVKRYRSIDAFAKNPIMSKKGFTKLQEIMNLAGELDQFVDFEQVVNTSIAEKVSK
jgi:NitT/TauT family transport system substrate-binding protein